MANNFKNIVNRPYRSEAQADLEIEQARRLEQHGTAFCRKVLNGATVTAYSDPSRSTRDPAYSKALHDISLWVVSVAMKFDPATLGELNRELTRLSQSGGK